MVTFRVSREVNPVPAIADFTDLNQEVFLLAAYGNVAGLAMVVGVALLFLFICRLFMF